LFNMIVFHSVVVSMDNQHAIMLLPLDNTRTIASWTDLPTLVSMTATCKEWRKIIWAKEGAGYQDQFFTFVFSHTTPCLIRSLRWKRYNEMLLLAPNQPDEIQQKLAK